MALHFPSTGPPPTPREGVIRRGADVLLAGIALILAAPLLALLALISGLTAGRPILYRGDRVGRDGARFTLYKLRTMAAGAEAHIGARLARPEEPVYTPLGPWLRRLHLDELPQLYNVLRGQMSVIGPRPFRPIFLDDHRRIPGFDRRMTVRPGLTGLAQIRGGYDTAPRDKLRYEVLYLRRRALPLDLWILGATVWRILTGRRPRPPRRTRTTGPRAR